MEILSETCVNSSWPARFLAKDDQECCECFGSCKVRVKNKYGYVYILTKPEIESLKNFESKCKIEAIQ